MKIQCDVCNKDEASVFCCADEAALCDGCDRRVHHANKLAGKHQRFSLLHPSSSAHAPLCDVCQERRAFLFCQQDRAILCRDCDLPIHTANHLTQNHNRFLLTGVKLAPINTTTSSGASDSSVPDRNKPRLPINKPISDSPAISHPPAIAKTSGSSTTANRAGGDNLLTSEAGSVSSISEYLIETLPGWHVEDLLDSSYAPYGFCKNDDMLPLLNSDLESSLSSFSSESLGVWVPQAPPPPPASLYSSHTGGQMALKDFKEASTMKAPPVWRDDAFTVPQISPPAIGSKRSRPF